MQELFILVIAGTARERRLSIHAARMIAAIGNSIEGVRTELVDPKEFVLPGDGNDPEGKDEHYSRLTAQADGFFIVTPEYNHSFPGSLKRILDSELQNYNHKPVALAGASSGPWGGVRAVESLVTAVREMGLVVTARDVFFPRIQELFDEQGTYLGDKHEQTVRAAYDELIWFAKLLKQGREAENS